MAWWSDMHWLELLFEFEYDHHMSVKNIRYNDEDDDDDASIGWWSDTGWNSPVPIMEMPCPGSWKGVTRISLPGSWSSFWGYGDYYGDFDDDDENHHHHRQNQCGQQDNSKDLTHKVSISTPPSTKAGPAVYEAIRPDGETKGRLQVQTMSLLCPKSVVSILNVIETSEISCNILGLIFHSTMPSCECWRGGGRGWG